jgi:hypothetical protein
MVDTGEYLTLCMAYIELNMVRAGVVSHPSEWSWCGYSELTGARQRYRLLSQPDVCQLVRGWSPEQPCHVATGGWAPRGRGETGWQPVLRLGRHSERHPVAPVHPVRVEHTRPDLQLQGVASAHMACPRVLQVGAAGTRRDRMNRIDRMSFIRPRVGFRRFQL